MPIDGFQYPDRSDPRAPASVGSSMTYPASSGSKGPIVVPSGWRWLRGLVYRIVALCFVLVVIGGVFEFTDRTTRTSASVALVGAAVLATAMVLIRRHLGSAQLSTHRIRGVSFAVAGVLLLGGVGVFGLLPFESLRFVGAVLALLALSHLIGQYRAIPQRRRFRAVVLGCIAIGLMAGGLFGPIAHPLTAILVSLAGLVVGYFAIISATQHTRTLMKSESDVKGAPLVPSYPGALWLVVGIAVLAASVWWFDSAFDSWYVAVAVGAVLLFVLAVASSSDSDIFIVLIAVVFWWATASTTSPVPERLAPELIEPVLTAGDTGEAETNGGVLLVFGDSFISGEGASGYVAGTNERGVNECRRAQTAHHSLIIQAALGDSGSPAWTERSSAAIAEVFPERVLSVACSGAKSEDIFSVAQFKVQPPYVDGASVPAEGLTQVELAHEYLAQTAATPEMVMVSIGGNDALFSTLVTTCLGPGDCSELADHFRSKLPTVRRSVGRVYAELEQFGVPIRVIPYPQPLGDAPCRLPLSAAEREFLQAFVAELNSELMEAVRQRPDFDPGIEIVSTVVDALDRTSGGPGRLCDGESTPGGLNFIDPFPVDGDLTERLNPLSWMHNSVHPNEAGHASMARAIVEHEVTGGQEVEHVVGHPSGEHPDAEEIELARTARELCETVFAGAMRPLEDEDDAVEGTAAPEAEDDVVADREESDPSIAESSGDTAPPSQDGCASVWALGEMRAGLQDSFGPLLLAIFGSWASVVAIFGYVDEQKAQLGLVRGEMTRRQHTRSIRGRLQSLFSRVRAKVKDCPSVLLPASSGLGMMMLARAFDAWGAWRLAVFGGGLVLSAALLIGDPPADPAALPNDDANQKKRDAGDSSKATSSSVKALVAVAESASTRWMIAFIAAALAVGSFPLLGGSAIVLLAGVCLALWGWRYWWWSDREFTHARRPLDTEQDPFRRELSTASRALMQLTYPILGGLLVVLFVAFALLEIEGVTAVAVWAGIAVTVAVVLVLFPMVVAKPRGRSSQVGLLVMVSLLTMAAGFSLPWAVRRASDAAIGSPAKDLPLLPGAILATALLVGASIVDAAMQHSTPDKYETARAAIKEALRTVTRRRIADLNTSFVGTLIGFAVMVVVAFELDGGTVYWVFLVTSVAIVLHWWAVFQRQVGHAWSYAITGVLLGACSVELLWFDGLRTLGRIGVAVATLWLIAKRFSKRTLHFATALLLMGALGALYRSGAGLSRNQQEGGEAAVPPIEDVLRTGLEHEWDKVFDTLSPFGIAPTAGIVGLVCVAVIGALTLRWLSSVNDRRLAVPVVVDDFVVPESYPDGKLLRSQLEAELVRAGITEPPFVPTESVGNDVISLFEPVGLGTSWVNMLNALRRVATPQRGTIVLPSLDIDEKNVATVTVRLKQARSGRILRAASFRAASAESAVRRAVAFVARSVMAMNSTTPGWAKWESDDGLALHHYLRAHPHSLYGDPNPTLEQQVELLTTSIAASPSTGLVRVELGHAYEECERPWRALRIYLEAAIDHERLVQAHYRVATSLSMLAGGLINDTERVGEVDYRDRVIIHRYLKIVLGRITNDNADFFEVSRELLLLPQVSDSRRLADVFLEAAENVNDYVLRQTTVPLLAANALIHEGERDHWWGLLTSSQRRGQERGRYIVLRQIIRLRLMDRAITDMLSETQHTGNLEDALRAFLQLKKEQQTVLNAVHDFPSDGTIYNSACYWSLYSDFLERTVPLLRGWIVTSGRGEALVRMGAREDDRDALRQLVTEARKQIAESDERGEPDRLRNVAVRQLFRARAHPGGQFPSRAWLSKDPDLVPVRNEPLFLQLLDWMERGEDAMRDARAVPELAVPTDEEAT